MKFNKEEAQEEIRNAKGGSKAASLGRSRKNKLRSDWEEVKEDIMYEALYAKFTQHRNLKKSLLDTGDSELIEHTKNDSYWGDGGNGKGKNMLGLLLMKLR